ncbi:MAG: hypothetical protein ACK4F9_05665 [Brevinematia bacterium]
MSKIRVRQSKNRLRLKLTEEEIQELRIKIRDPSYIDHVVSELACIIFSKIGDTADLSEVPETNFNQKG